MAGESVIFYYCCTNVLLFISVSLCVGGGFNGIAFSFCDPEEKEFLRDIHKVIGKQIPIENEHPFAMDPSTPSVPPPKQNGNQNFRGGSYNRNNTGNSGNRSSNNSNANNSNSRRRY